MGDKPTTATELVKQLKQSTDADPWAALEALAAMIDGAPPPEPSEENEE